MFVVDIKGGRYPIADVFMALEQILGKLMLIFATMNLDALRQNSISVYSTLSEFPLSDIN